MKKLIYFLVTLFFFSSCNSNNFESISYEQWGDSVNHLLSQYEKSDKSQINHLLKEISEADFIKLKSIIKTKKIDYEFFVIDVYEGEVITEILIYIVEIKSNIYKSTITLQRGEKDFSESFSSSKVDFKNLIKNKSGGDVYNDSIIITNKNKNKILSYFTYTTDEILDFL